MALQYLSTPAVRAERQEAVNEELETQQRVAEIVPVVAFSTITFFKAYLSLVILREATITNVLPVAPFGAPIVIVKFLPP